MMRMPWNCPAFRAGVWSRMRPWRQAERTMLAPSIRMPARMTGTVPRTKNMQTRPAKAAAAAGTAAVSLPFRSIARPKATLMILAAVRTTPRITA